MITNTATPEDFTRWTAHAKQCDDAALLFIITDCREAARAMQGFNPDREGYYMDQSFTYADEWHRRKKKREGWTLIEC